MYRARSSPAAWNTGSASLDERRQPLGRRALRLEVEADHARLDLPAQLGHAIAGRRGALGEGICAPERVAALASPVQGFAEVGLEGEVELGRRDERGGALEQADGGAVVLPGAARGGRRRSGAAAPPRPDRRRRAVPSSAR